MTFAELKQEVSDRGYDFITSARIGTFVNRSYQAICARYAWPFLEASASGTAPLTITDLGHVLSVSDTSNDNRLYQADRRTLTTYDPDLSGTGTASWWYLEGTETLKVYPADTTSTFAVRYLSAPADLSADADEPVIPSAWQYLIVDGAVVYCLKDDDEYASAQALKASVDADIALMVHALMNRNYTSGDSIQFTGRPGDYL